MSEGESQDSGAPVSDVVNCAECGTQLERHADREVTDNGTFCRPCYNNLTAQLHQAVAAQSQHINYPLAFR